MLTSLGKDFKMLGLGEVSPKGKPVSDVFPDIFRKIGASEKNSSSGEENSLSADLSIKNLPVSMKFLVFRAIGAIDEGMGLPGNQAMKKASKRSEQRQANHVDKKMEFIYAILNMKAEGNKGTLSSVRKNALTALFSDPKRVENGISKAFDLSVSKRQTSGGVLQSIRSIPGRLRKQGNDLVFDPAEIGFTQKNQDQSIATHEKEILKKTGFLAQTLAAKGKSKQALETGRQNSSSENIIQMSGKKEKFQGIAGGDRSGLKFNQLEHKQFRNPRLNKEEPDLAIDKPSLMKVFGGTKSESSRQKVESHDFGSSHPDEQLNPQKGLKRVTEWGSLVSRDEKSTWVSQGRSVISVDDEKTALMGMKISRQTHPAKMRGLLEQDPSNGVELKAQPRVEQPSLAKNFSSLQSDGHGLPFPKMGPSLQTPIDHPGLVINHSVQDSSLSKNSRIQNNKARINIDEKPVKGAIHEAGRAIPEKTVHGTAQRAAIRSTEHTVKNPTLQAEPSDILTKEVILKVSKPSVEALGKLSIGQSKGAQSGKPGLKANSTSDEKPVDSMVTASSKKTQDPLRIVGKGLLNQQFSSSNAHKTSFAENQSLELKPKNKASSIPEKILISNLHAAKPANEVEIAQEIPKSRQLPIIKQAFDEISSSIRMAPREVILKLEPESLGKLRIKVSVEMDQVRTQITAENVKVVALFKSTQGDLQQHLKDQGFDLRQFDVNQDSQSGGDQARHSQDDANYPKTSSAFSRAEDSDHMIEEPLPVFSHQHNLISTDRVNVTV